MSQRLLVASLNLCIFWRSYALKVQNAGTKMTEAGADGTAHRSRSVQQIPHIMHIGSNLTEEMVYHPRWGGNHFIDDSRALIKQTMGQNPGWKLDLLTDARIMDLVAKRPMLYPQDDPAFHSSLLSLLKGGTLGVEKSDLGRLLALEAEGGVYVDSDVHTQLPVAKWAQEAHQDLNSTDLVVGVETLPASHTNDGKKDFQITNWAMAATPGCRLLTRIITKMVERAPHIPDRNVNVLRRTGPVALTKILLESLQDYGESLPDMSEFTQGDGHVYRLKEEDGGETKVLILPYRSFGFRPRLGNAFGDNYDKNNLVRHAFFGRWKHRERSVGA